MSESAPAKPNSKRKRVIAAAVAGAVAVVAVVAGLTLLRPQDKGATQSTELAAGMTVPPGTMLDGPTINDLIAKICVTSANTTTSGSYIPTDLRENVEHLVFVRNASLVNATEPYVQTNSTGKQGFPTVVDISASFTRNDVTVPTTYLGNTPDVALIWDHSTKTLYFATTKDQFIFNPNSDSMFAGLRNLTTIQMYSGGSFSPTTASYNGNGGLSAMTYSGGTQILPTGYDLCSKAVGGARTTSETYILDKNRNDVSTQVSGYEFTYGVTDWATTKYGTDPTTWTSAVRKARPVTGLQQVTNLIDGDLFDLTYAIYLGSLFEECESLRDLEIRNWNTADIGKNNTTTITDANGTTSYRENQYVDFHSMFEGMKSLECLILPEHFVQDNVVRLDHMFQDDTMLSLVLGCEPDRSGGGYKPDRLHTNYNATPVTMSRWYRASTLELYPASAGTDPTRAPGDVPVIIPGWDQPHLTTWGFGGRWYLDDWDVSRVTDMSFMLADCWSLKKLDLTSWRLRPAYLPSNETLTLDSTPTTQPAAELPKNGYPTSSPISTASGSTTGTPNKNVLQPLNPLVRYDETNVNVNAMFDGAGLEELRLPLYPAVAYEPVYPRTTPLLCSELNNPITCINVKSELYDPDNNPLVVVQLYK